MRGQPWLVTCPRCAEQATIDRGRPPLLCPICGLSRVGPAELAGDGKVCQALGPRRRGETYELWLQEVCCGGRVLWATNAAHLEHLRRYVADRMQDRLGANL